MRASSSSRAFCSLLSFLGTRDASDHMQVAMPASRDVRHALATQPEARARLVPAGMCSSSRPSRVGTLTWPPSASVGNATGNSQ